MRFSVLPLLCGIHLAQACSENNCLRALIASAFPSRTASADCSSYLQTTITPATVTYTATVSATVPDIVAASTTETDTVTSPTTVIVSSTSTIVVTDVFTSTTIAHAPAKRQVTVVPSNVPAYASACSGAVKYASACSCIGISAVTITAEAPSTTITVSATSTSTSTSTSTITTFVTSFTPVTSTIEESTTISTSTTTTDILPCGTDSPNLVANPGFFNADITEWTTDWTVTSTGDGHTSLNAKCSPEYDCALLVVNSGPGSITISQTLNTIPGTEYAFSYFYKYFGSSGATIGCTAGSTFLGLGGIGGGTFTQVSTTFVATDVTTPVSCFIECTAPGCSGFTDFDAVSVVALC